MDEMDGDFESDGQIDAEEEEALLKSDEDDENESIKVNEDDIDNDEDVSNSSSSDEDDDKDHEKYLTEYNSLLKIIEQNKYNYDNYIQLIDLAHKLDDLETIRKSYKLFSTIYPIAPEIWLKWLSIETSIATSTNEIKEVEKLFRKALNDYYCPKIALEFSKFCSKLENSDEVWDEILSTYALHCMYGTKFFTLWREYYNKKEDKTELEKLQKICKIYQYELRLPLYEMEESYIEFKVLYQKNKNKMDLHWDDIEKKYIKAKEELKIMLPFEKQLQELNPKFYQEKAELFKTYINNVKNSINKSSLQIIFERMVTECCLNEKCWLDYINYVENRDLKLEDEEENRSNKNLIFSQTSFDICDRALRNCTWSYKIYILKMRLFEYNGSTREDIQSVLEQALGAGFQSPEPIVNIWIEYLSCLRRFTDYTDEKEVEILRNNFDYAWKSLGKLWGVLADCNCEILQLWGRLEYGPLRDPLKGRELWTTVMESADNATKSGLWIEYIHLEMKHDLNATRRIFQKALSFFNEMDNPMVIVSAWLRFEHSNGNLEKLENCEKQIEKILEKISANKVNEEQRTKIEKKNLKRKFDKTGSEKSETTALYMTDKPSKFTENNKSFKLTETKKAKLTTINESKTVLKEHENDEIDITKDHLRIFLSNLDYNITEEEIRASFPEFSIVDINLVKSASGKGRGFGYVELNSEEEVESALKLDNRLIKGRPVYISSVLRDKEKRQKFKYSSGLEPKKLFVKGIPYDATNEELKSIFEKYGKLRDVRIVYHKNGKSKGIAYIEYEDETSASVAVLKLDQYELRGHFFNVAISAPPPPKTTKESTLNVKKFFGLGAKKPSIRSEQKPRMNLIPTSVRRLAQSTIQSTTINGNKTAATVNKTNEDFRKELLKEK